MFVWQMVSTAILQSRHLFASFSTNQKMVVSSHEAGHEDVRIVRKQMLMCPHRFMLQCEPLLAAGWALCMFCHLQLLCFALGGSMQVVLFLG